MIPYNITAVVVTYNRLELLKQTIECLLKQTYPVYKIIIINNASTDGTGDYLNEIKNDSIVIRSLNENLGGAGGFYHGLGIAYNIGCDFAWIMDDDCLCSTTALEELITAYNLISGNKERNIGFLASDVRFTDGQPCLMNISGPAYIYNEYLKYGIVQVTHTSFVAMLIPSIVIREVGLPYKDFFIWGDDGEYSTRIAINHLGYVVGKSVVTHSMKENMGVNIFETPPERIDRFYYFYRNWMFTHKSRNKTEKNQFIRDNIKLTLKLLKSKNGNRKKKIRTVWRGVLDGLKFKASIDSVQVYAERYGDML